MTNNTQLPAEVVKEINKKAEDYMGYVDNSSEAYSDIEPYQVKDAWKLGATEYATKLHQAQQENEELKRSLTISDAACTVLNEQETAARTLLQKFISRHEAGLLPDRFIYNEIKKFLDGKGT